jgi:SAM-dependent methyltransferase
MPTSRVELIPMVIETVRECAAIYGVRSILDVGCGSGLYGALLRQYFDFAHNRFDGEDSLKITGIEPFEGYKNPSWEHYDVLHQLTLEEFLKDFPDEKFDVVLALDVLEHLEKPQAVEAMEKLYERAEKYLIITTPTTFRDQWQPEKPWESELQRHRCHLTPDILESIFHRFRVQTAPGGLVWMALVKKEFLGI